MSYNEVVVRQVVWMIIVFVCSFAAGLLLIRGIAHAVLTEDNFAIGSFSLEDTSEAAPPQKTLRDTIVLSAHITKIGDPAITGCGCPACCAAYS